MSEHIIIALACVGGATIFVVTSACLLVGFHRIFLRVR